MSFLRRIAGAGAALAIAASGLVLSQSPALALENGLLRTPPMGFNNWNSTQCKADFNETMIRGIADLFVSKGLKDVGYTYVNIDDCWALPDRDAKGNLVPDPARFPHGIKALADYVHAQGPEVRHLHQRRHQHVQQGRLPRRARPRAAGREPLRLLGRRLPEVRQLQQPGRRRAAALQGDAATRSRSPAAPIVYSHLRVGPEPAVDLGRAGRQPVAHHR